MNELSNGEIILLFGEAKNRCNQYGLYLYLQPLTLEFIIERKPIPYGGWVATYEKLTEVFDYLEGLDNRKYAQILPKDKILIDGDRLDNFLSAINVGNEKGIPGALHWMVLSNPHEIIRLQKAYLTGQDGE